MKKVLSAIVSIALAIVITSSCGMTQNLASMGSSGGNTSGRALTALLGQYLKDGKLDTSNLSTLINLATLASSIQGLKGNSNNTNVLSDFAQGLVRGSNNQITPANSSTVTTILANLANNVDLSSLASVLTRSAEVGREEAASLAVTPEVASAASVAGSIFKLMDAGK